MKKHLRAALKKVTIERVGRVYSIACLVGYTALVMSDAATAQSLRATGESVFNTIYGIVGVAGGIAVVTSAVNWKMGNFLGARDPKQAMIHSVVGTGIAFGGVGIVQAIKTAVGSSSGISGV
jgi:hypothetical protein